MKLESQVCTLEQAKKLKALGVIQESLFCFIGDDNPNPKYNQPHVLYYTPNAWGEVGAGWYDSRIAAFTVAELGVMLDNDCLVERSKAPNTRGKYYVLIKGQTVFFDTEVEALSASLIYWIEDGFTTVEEVNQRLLAA